MKRKHNELILSGALQVVQELKKTMSTTTDTPNKKWRNLSSPTSTATTVRRFTRSHNKKLLRSGKEIGTTDFTKLLE